MIAVTSKNARSAWPPVLTGVVGEATGRTRRDDPVLPGTGGPAGNAHLTAWTGLVLLAFFLVELVTLIDVRGLISWHIVVGTLLVPPALLKTVSTGWRIGRYYRHDPAYGRAGPPPLLLRVLGPGVVGSTLALLTSGLLLIVLGPGSSRTVLVSALGQRVDAVTLHQGLFIVWGVLTGLHVLARIVPSLRLTLIRPTGAAPVPGGARRAVGVLVALAVGCISAGIVLAASGPWQNDDNNGNRDRPPHFTGSTR